MTDPASLAKTIETANKVANTPLFTTVIDKITGFKLSKWAAEGEVRKKLIHDEYEKAKEGGIMGMQYIEYMRSTENLINTAVKSSKYIDSEKPNEIQMDNDFFWNTIEHAKTVSNEDMQELIAKIIAGEYNEPGSYLMSTLQTLKMLGRLELHLLERICSLCLDDFIIPKNVFFTSQKRNPVFSNLDIDFGKLQSLTALGLVLPNDMTRTLENKDRKNFAISYFGNKLIFVPQNIDSLEIAYPDFFQLSITGQQIAEHLNPEFNGAYFEWLKDNFKVKNYELIRSS